MAQLWGGRFTKETDQLVYNFNASIGFDQKFYRQDIEGSIAHVTMLESIGVLSAAERDQIVGGLNSILSDIESGTIEITSEYEDIHSFVEANLIDRIGRCRKEASHRKEPKRSGGSGHETLYQRRNHFSQGTFKGSYGKSASDHERQS